jgi:adenylate cyclase
MTTRRLAAILAADVAGFSAMMERDEEGTAARIRALRVEVIEPALARHHGRLVKTTGDGFLAEFASPVEAVRSALAIQDQLSGADGVNLRIGINLGDIIIEDDGDVFGDGVNVAARLEQMADPGGICLSGKIHAEIEGKIDRAFEDRGEQQVKNIARPVRVYALAVGSPSGSQQRALSLPDKPSIAVLPFTNMSADPEQDYFADGISEDLITAISKWRWLFVIARNSSFTYRGRAVDVKTVGRELGVRYVLEGSVRKSGPRIRITGQLIETETGTHVWADRYDGEIGDVFTFQDAITQRVTTALDPAIRNVEARRLTQKPPATFMAYDFLLRGSAHFFAFKKAELASALECFEAAIRLDHAFAPAFARLAQAYGCQVWMGWADDAEASAEAGVAAGRRAIALDDLDSAGYVGLSINLCWLRKFDAAIAAGQRATELNENDFWSHFALGLALVYGGEPVRAIGALRTATRINPHDPYAWGLLGTLALAHYCAGELEQALVTAQQSIRERGRYFIARVVEIAASAHLGRVEYAESAARHLADWATVKLLRGLPFRRSTDLEHLANGLCLAGLPE